MERIEKQYLKTQGFPSIDKNIDLQIQETSYSSIRINIKNLKLKHSVVKLQKNKDKKKSFLKGKRHGKCSTMLVGH